MIGRKMFTALATAAALSGAAGCKVVSEPPKADIAQDVEFLRGCWVAKAGPNGPVTAFLRLLPDGADGPAYQGYLQNVTGADTTAAMHLSFARDGSSMTMRDPRGGPVMPKDQAGGPSRPYIPLPDAIAAKLAVTGRRASYAVYAGQPATPFLIAEGSGEALAIYQADNTGVNMGDVFRGERDGCD